MTRRTNHCEGCTSQFGSNVLPPRHLLSREHQDFPIAFCRSTKKAAKLVKPTYIFSGAAPCRIVSSLELRNIRQSGWFFPIIKELIYRDFKSTGQFLKRLDRRDRVSVFHTRNVGAKQSRSFLDLALCKILRLTQCPQTVPDIHGLILHSIRMIPEI